MIKFKPLPPLERLHELLEVVEIPPEKYGEWSGLVRKVTRGGKRAGTIAGTRNPSSNSLDRIDWRVQVDGVYYHASRIIYYMTYSKDPGNIQVDHKDQNWLNNNAQNLRLDTDGSIQKVNTPKRRDNTSGIVSVHLDKCSGKWMVRVPIGGERKNLGYYTCKIEAARVVRDKWIELGWDKLGRELPKLNEIKCDCSRCSANF
jgi:hypothetical protein